MPLCGPQYLYDKANECQDDGSVSPELLRRYASRTVTLSQLASTLNQQGLRAHESTVSEEVFLTVQDALKRNSGRSETLDSRPEREYLLKGLIRCAHCLMPMWAQTYTSGHRYYREQ